MEDKRYFTTGEVARLLGVSAFAVWKWIRDEKIRAIKTPGGHYRIPREEVDRLLKANVGD